MNIKPHRDFLAISSTSNFILHLILILITILMVLPLVFVFSISFTSEESISQFGYQFVPHKWTLEAYVYLFKNGVEILRAFMVSIFVTVIGTFLGTLIVTTFAYVISRKTFIYKKFFTILVLIPMLFNGGLVSNYLIMTTFLGLKDSFWALILPLLMNTFWVFIMKSFYVSFISDSLIDSAKIDGASDLRTFFSIVVPIAKPGMATIALFLTLGYWNDWFNAMLYIEDSRKIPIQYFLIKIENTATFLARMSSQMGASDLSAQLPSDNLKMAIVIIVVLPIALAYPYFQKYFVKGLTMGGVKE